MLFRSGDRLGDRPVERHPRRDRDSEASTGPAVQGFGSDVPAFMLLRPRVAPAARTEGDGEA